MTNILFFQLPELVCNKQPLELKDDWGINCVNELFRPIKQTQSIFSNIPFKIKAEHTFEKTTQIQVVIKSDQSVIYNNKQLASSDFQIILKPMENTKLTCFISLLSRSQILFENQIIFEQQRPYTANSLNQQVTIVSNLPLPINLGQTNDFNFILVNKNDKINIPNTKSFHLYSTNQLSLGILEIPKNETKILSCKINSIIKLELPGQSINWSPINGLDFIEYSENILYLFANKQGIYSLKEQFVDCDNQLIPLQNYQVQIQ